MNRLKFNLFLVCLISLAFGACDDTPVNPQQTCALNISVQNEFTTPPAKVSMFFKVDDCNDDPIAGLGESNFTIYEQGQNDNEYKKISESEAARKISDNSQLFIHNTFLVLDLSGSVTNNNLTELKTAAKNFVDVVIPSNNSSYQMGIWWFDGEDSLHALIPLTNNPTSLKAAIDNIHSGISSDNSTDLYGAVLKSTALAVNELNQSTLAISAASVVIFTDGTDQAARYTTSQATNAVLNSGNDITHFSIGLGDEIDKGILEQVGTDGFSFASNTSELNSKFNEVAEYISDEANSYYLFEYCSPKRAGSTNKLKIQIQSGDMAGTKETSFDASQFGGGCTL
ncbi:VWA domain-containing protein [Aureispira anguillae]|uniref:VWA domain-containing protein n=1 Tax=Aureispira anguillae TaxID=2864201 RepID=A0A915YKT6_9BACT|nr:VWA domain-containing protein [Aureispira anguillae]BDS14933.1 VWA domain-containing protein [Aureispira anguillae]